MTPRKKFSRTRGGPEPVDVHVGARLRSRRVATGISQEKLAEAVGVTFQQVQKYERGDNRMGASRLWQFARILDVEIGYFFEDMPEATSGAAPRTSAGAVTDLYRNDPENKRDALELTRYFAKITNKSVRTHILALVKLYSKIDRQAVSPAEAA